MFLVGRDAAKPGAALQNVLFYWVWRGSPSGALINLAVFRQSDRGKERREI
jgi:hypothetical protein